MITLFGGRFHLGRLPTEQQRHNELLRVWKKIMATLNEVTAQLKEANAKLAESNGKLTAANALNAATKEIITKIGTETDKLKDQIANLPPAGDASPELVAALEEIKGTINAASSLADQAQTVAGAASQEADTVDKKVDD